MKINPPKNYIGKKYVPSDNSYIINLTYPNRTRYLAGTGCGEEPKECVIVSNPYEFLINSRILDNGGEIHEFVNVKYDNDIYRVLFNERNIVW